jgi:hypothetical protein
MRRLAAICIALVGITASAGEPSFELDQPSFVLDVMPILSKAGCNGGGCHGALAGKAGFRLSLFGYDPESDYLAITRDARGRRVDLADPGASLLLTKPTTALPHKGGKRLDVGGDDYKLLAAWIEAGSPGPRENEKKLLGIDLAPAESPAALGQAVALTVTARYDDGSSRDVTRWARFTSADETVASVDPVGRVSVVGHGAGAVTAWFSSQIAVARRRRLRRRAAGQLHRRPQPRATRETAPQALAAVRRGDVSAAGVSRHGRPAAAPGGGAGVSRRPLAGEEGAARGPAARAAGVRRLLDIQVVRHPARVGGEAAAGGGECLLAVDPRPRLGERAVGSLRP